MTLTTLGSKIKWSVRTRVKARMKTNKKKERATDLWVKFMIIWENFTMERLNFGVWKSENLRSLTKDCGRFGIVQYCSFSIAAITLSVECHLEMTRYLKNSGSVDTFSSLNFENPTFHCREISIQKWELVRKVAVSPWFVYVVRADLRRPSWKAT